MASEFGDGISLTSPTLNISVYQMPPSLNGTKGGEDDVYQPDATVFLSGNTLYRQIDFKDKAKCQADNVSHALVNPLFTTSDRPLDRPTNGASRSFSSLSCSSYCGSGP